MSCKVSHDFHNRIAIPQTSYLENEKWIGGMLQSAPEDKLKEISNKIWWIIAEKVPNKAFLTDSRHPGLNDLFKECSLGSKSQLIRGRFFEFGFSDVLNEKTCQLMQNTFPQTIAYRIQLDLDFQQMKTFPELVFRIMEKSGEQILSQYWVRV